MRFLVPPCALVLLIAGGVRSQPGPEIKDGKSVLKMTVSPADPPVPTFRYTLLPTVRGARPGNQVPGFYKCFMEQQFLFFNKDAEDKREAWLSAPLDELKDVAELVGYGGSAVTQARKASRMEFADWQLLADMREDGINTLLPDLQQMRGLARVLRVRARGEIARGDFPAAVDTIQIHLGLARAFNEHPTLIGSLVGLAVTAQALASVEEFVARPGAPNLFWALADLPNPLFDLRKARHGERNFLTGDVDVLIDRKRRMADDQLDAAVARTVEMIGQVTLQHGLAPAKGASKDGPPPKRVRPPVPKAADLYLEERAQDAKQVADARKKLGPGAEKFPPMQVILIDELDRFEAARDDIVKWLAVPHWQMPADFDKTVPPGAFTQLAPAALKVAIARTRTQQQIGMLQVVEGVRLYAAANGGKLPATLDDLKLPLPLDPFTGRAFRYEVANGVATVRGTPPAGREDDPTLNRVYEVRLRP